MASADFNVEEYLARYRGVGRVHRAEYLADSALLPSQVRSEAQRLLVQILHDETRDTSTYRHVCEKFKIARDEQWEQNTEAGVEAERKQLEQQLQTAMSASDKAAVRQAAFALGKLHVVCGAAQAAIKQFTKVRDYTSSSQHTLEMTLHIMYASYQAQNWTYIQTYAAKAEHVLASASAKDRAKVNVYQGLVHLKHARYRECARLLLKVSAELGDEMREVVLGADIALYAGVCALVTYKRGEFKRNVLENGDFQMLGTDCADLRELIDAYYSTRYADMVAAMARLEAPMRRDMHIGSSVSTLFKRLRENALIQYYKPYNTVDLRLMATAFGTDVDALEREMGRLIGDGKVHARIDSHQKRLVRTTSDQRTETYDAVLRVGNAYEEEAKLVMLRAGIMRHRLEIKGRDLSRMVDHRGRGARGLVERERGGFSMNSGFAGRMGNAAMNLMGIGGHAPNRAMTGKRRKGGK